MLLLAQICTCMRSTPNLDVPHRRLLLDAVGCPPMLRKLLQVPTPAADVIRPVG